MILSIQFLLLVYINTAKLMLGSVNAVRHMLMLPVQVPAAEVNPIIYTSCIEQFCATAKVQTVNEVRQLQALVDKKKVIITESSIRSDLHLDDAEGTDCLPTVTIFEELACMGAKSTAWNEFSSTMASLIIYLATNQKFNLSKYIFDAMVKQLDGEVKFLMYLPSEEVGEDSIHLTDSDQIPIIDQPSTSSETKQKQKSKRRQKKEAKVLDLEKAKDAQAKEIAALKKRVQRLERKKKSGATGLRRIKKVSMSRRVESSEDQENLGDPEDASKQGRSIEDIDVDDEVTLVNETQERHDDNWMFDTRVLDDDEVFVDATTIKKEEQSTKTGEAITTVGVEHSAAPTIPITEEQVSVFKPTVSVTQPLVKDKGKGIIQEPERPLTKKDQVSIDEDLARNIQAQLDAEIIEEERLER
ncbi:hypothetical protein Tco_0851782 [Tanacetum coccineum]